MKTKISIAISLLSIPLLIGSFFTTTVFSSVIAQQSLFNDLEKNLQTLNNNTQKDDSSYKTLVFPDGKDGLVH